MHEEEELKHDISKLQDQLQQISISQRESKDDLDGLKADMESLKEGLTKTLQEITPNGETVVDETHDENKINVNHDFIDFNVGFKTFHIPKIDMRNFYGKDPITWILPMEQYFDLHNVKNTL